MQNGNKDVILGLSLRDKYDKEASQMFCFKNLDCSAIWETLCKYLGIGC